MKKILLPILFMIGLTACGGGSSSTSNLTDNALHTFDGTWQSACEYDADFNESEILLIILSGNNMGVGITIYPTSDCSGLESVTIQKSFPIRYSGEYAASTCIAEKIDFDIADMTDAEIKSAKDSELPLYNLMCIDAEGKLRGGNITDTLDGTTAEKRPKEMDMSGAGLTRQ